MTRGLRNMEFVEQFTADELTVMLCRETLSDGSNVWALGFITADSLPNYLDMATEKVADTTYSLLLGGAVNAN